MPPANSPGYDSGATLDYVENATSTNVTATTQASPNTLITGNKILVAGRIRLEFWCAGLNMNNFSNSWTDFYEDGTSIGELSRHLPANGVDITPITFVIHRTPAAGFHTYTVGGYTQAASTIEYRSNSSYGYSPMYLLITSAPR